MKQNMKTKTRYLIARTICFAVFIFLGPGSLAEERTSTLKEAESVCLNEQTAKEMSAYCDLVYGYLKESRLPKTGLQGKRILIGRCDDDQDCPLDSKCHQGRCYQDVLSKESCLSDFDCRDGKSCHNSLCE